MADPLLLIPGQLPRVALRFVAQLHPLKRRQRPLLRFGARHACHDKAECDVVQHRQPLDEVKMLKDEAYVRRRSSRSSSSFMATMERPSKKTSPASGSMKTVDAAQQRRLAAAARPHHDDRFARLDG